MCPRIGGRRDRPSSLETFSLGQAHLDELRIQTLNAVTALYSDEAELVMTGALPARGKQPLRRR